MNEEQLNKNFAALESSSQAMAAEIGKALSGIAELRAALKAAERAGAEQKLILRKVEQFDALMRGAKGTQEKLAGEITQILGLLRELEAKVTERFDNYDKAVLGIRETQKKLAAEIGAIAARVG